MKEKAKAIIVIEIILTLVSFPAYFFLARYFGAPLYNAVEFMFIMTSIAACYTKVKQL